jgi:hydroxymethylpyrimidine/phosphomethylpyrimidine kinase
MQGDLLDARVVTAPCLIGYGHVGARLLAATEGVETDETKNPYWGWIKEYGSDWYQGAVRKGIRESRSIALFSTRPR